MPSFPGVDPDKTAKTVRTWRGCRWEPWDPLWNGGCRVGNRSGEGVRQRPSGLHRRVAGSDRAVRVQVCLLATSEIRHQRFFFARCSRSSDKFEIGINSGNGLISFYDATWKSTLTTGPMNAWTHIVMTWGTNARTYQNGTLSPTVAGGRTLSGDQFFGARWNDVEGYYGIIDEVRLFDRALGDSEIAGVTLAGPRLSRFEFGGFVNLGTVVTTPGLSRGFALTAPSDRRYSVISNPVL